MHITTWLTFLPPCPKLLQWEKYNLAPVIFTYYIPFDQKISSVRGQSKWHCYCYCSVYNSIKTQSGRDWQDDKWYLKKCQWSPEIDNTIEEQKETEYWIEYTYWSRLITFSTPSWPDEEESDRRALWVAWASFLFSAIDGPLCFSSTEKKPCLPPSKITLIIKLRLSARDSTSKFLIVKMLTILAILVKQNEKEVLKNRALKKQSNENRVGTECSEWMWGTETLEVAFIAKPRRCENKRV